MQESSKGSVCDIHLHLTLRDVRYVAMRGFPSTRVSSAVKIDSCLLAQLAPSLPG